MLEKEPNQNSAIKNQPETNIASSVGVQEDTKQENKKPKLVLWLSLIAIFLLTSFLSYYFLIYKQREKYPSEKQIGFIIEKEEREKTSKDYLFDVGFQISLPKKWHSRFVDNTNRHLLVYFIRNKLTKYPQIEVEGIKSSDLDKETWENPLYLYSSSESKKVNDLTVEIKEGEEKYQSSNKKVKTAFIKNNDKFLKITLLTDEFDAENQALFNEILDSVQLKSKLSSGFVKVASAEEKAFILPSPIANLNYKEIKIMDSPLEEQITKNDPPVSDGYAKGYVFYAHKSQRLTTVALEDRSSNPGSFIRSAVYDVEGNIMTGSEKDTRVEYEAPASGYYFLVVRSFNNQEGKFKLRVFDRDQVENKVFIKYKNGEEKFLDYNKNLQVREEEVAIIFEFVSPVEILPDNVVRYQGKPREFEPSPGLVITPIEVYSMPGKYDDLKASSVVLPEDKKENKNNINLTKIGPARILITPINGLFAKNLHIYVKEQSIGGYRFFTENEQPTIAVTPTPFIPTPTVAPQVTTPVSRIIEANGKINIEGKDISFGVSFPENGGEFKIVAPEFCDFENRGYFEGKDSPKVSGTISAICNYLGISFDVKGRYFGDVLLKEGRGEGSWETTGNRKGNWTLSFSPLNY